MKQVSVDDISDDAQIRAAKRYLSETLFLMLKDELARAIFLENIENISVKYLDRDEFLKMINLKEDAKNIPRAYCLEGNIFSQKDPQIKKQVIPILKHEKFHVLIHEMLHALADNFKYTGKAGLQQYYIDEQNNLYSNYRVINEAATEYLASSLLGEPFLGRNIDLKYTLQIIMELASIDDDELVNLYFQENNWVDEEISTRFNSDDPSSLNKLLIMYDEWFPSPINPSKNDQLYDFSNVSEILLNAINQKIDNHEVVNYKKISDLLNKLLKDCYWLDINENIIEKYNETLDRLLLFVKNR